MSTLLCSTDWLLLDSYQSGDRQVGMPQAENCRQII